MKEEKQKKREADLGNDPVGPLLVRLALPTICAQVVNLLYNIVDRIYIGQIPGEGALALHEVQLVGGKRMKSADFLRGHAIAKGTMLGE